MASIHDEPEISPEEEEHMKNMARYRDHLIAKTIERRERAAKEAIAGGASPKVTITKSPNMIGSFFPQAYSINQYRMTSSGDGHCTSSAPKEATSANKEANGVEGKTV
ncbi:hypothetical protein C5167_045197 [Papaver somniferum]|uniref:Uncharacterized protein n=1 Tax=Papaver somniferum TaxID=3469 RepID=A0A4Y7LDQ1_PAPSO|nr:hypothetical protein C5167_045197 [Papaver somniferum]